LVSHADIEVFEKNVLRRIYGPKRERERRQKKGKERCKIRSFKIYTLH
jgi:hypothetical protein